MCKKIITAILIMTVLLNTTLGNYVFASTLTLNELESGRTNTLSDKYNGTSKVTSTETRDIHSSSSSFNLVYTVLAFLLVQIPLVVQTLLTLAILPDDITETKIFTIEDLLLNRFELFDVNFVDIYNVSNITEPDYSTSKINRVIKQNVANWFYALRTFSVVALFAILIAVGILMAISSIGSDKAKYKNMLIHWAASMAILIFLPYIMSISFNVCRVTINVVKNISISVAPQNEIDDPDIEQTKGINFEKTLIFGKVNKNGKGFDGLLSRIQNSDSGNLLALTLVYGVIVYYQIKFFFMYLKRMLSVGFLVVISPLITITYSIDKARDNQAQAFTTWLKEFLVNVFIQPLHALLFVIFMATAYAIMERAPLLAIIFLAALSRGEKIVRSIFKIERTVSLGRLKKGKG